MLLCVRRLNISILFFIGVTEAFNNVLDYVFIAQEPSRNASVTSADQALHIFYLWLVTEALSMGNCSSRRTFWIICSRRTQEQNEDAGVRATPADHPTPEERDCCVTETYTQYLYSLYIYIYT